MESKCLSSECASLLAFVLTYHFHTFIFEKQKSRSKGNQIKSKGKRQKKKQSWGINIKVKEPFDLPDIEIIPFLWTFSALHLPGGYGGGRRQLRVNTRRHWQSMYNYMLWSYPCQMLLLHWTVPLSQKLMVLQ